MIIDIPEFAALNAKLDLIGTSLASVQLKLDKLAATLVPAPVPVPVVPKSQCMVVTYFRDAAMWAATLATKPPFVIINPNSGSGPTADSLYVAQIPRNTAAGVPTFGYTHTRYAARPVQEVKDDVLRYLSQYPVLKGFFVDTTSNKPEHVPYYEELCAWLRGISMQICLNPGTKAPERLAQISDYVMCVETDYTTYMASIRQSWELMPVYRPKLWHLAHNCSESNMPAVVAKMKRDNAGLITVTDDVMANPYDKLPSYLTALNALVEAP